MIWPMRITIGVLIIAFVAAASVQAQSVRILTIRELVELSKAERARRAGQRVEGRIFTSEDIERYVPPVAEVETDAADGEELVAEDEGAATEESEGVLSDSEEALILWQEAVADQRLQIQVLEDREVSPQLSITEIRGIVTGPIETQEERNRAMTNLAAAETRLAQIRT